MDPHGYFLISLEDNAIVAQHCLPNGQRTQYVFRGKKADDMYRRILHEGIILKLDHAAYLGRELARAEESLRRGEKYIQDDNDDR